ncbi:hypothetical protein B6I21_07390 [candidate division KSB1 bacterium 4572_119]|nr:MAG: hypothetical protein B6I21_07390 [candidate division KSB1 bacterium 4572_119]
MAKPYPRHYYLNDTVYFITAHVYKKHSYLDSENNKQVLLDTLNNVLDESRYKLYCWVILKDHYHFLFKTRIGEKLPGLMKQIHKLVSIQINDLDEKKRRKVFQNYWDCCIRDKKDFYLHFNYIHQNPVKHGYVEDESE